MMERMEETEKVVLWMEWNQWNEWIFWRHRQRENDRRYWQDQEEMIEETWSKRVVYLSFGR
jgi:hypothetical protein